ncbi:MAG: peptide chain release factor N(5)-glutamine methyltransferase, partial [Thermoanaerobaculia bacterium]
RPTITPTIDRLLADTRRRLAAAPFRPSTREAALLLGRVLGLSEAQVLARSRDRVPATEARRFRELLERRLAGEPVAYLLGEKEFFGRPFAVDRRVLIPRPESEHLVESALAQRLPEEPRILDVGTGSGCLAVTLALELPGARVTAVDVSPAALVVASANARRHGVAGRVVCAAADLVRGLELSRFDLVVSNPPYIDPATAQELSPEIREHEPPAALFAEGRGRAILDRLLRELAALRSGAPLILEIGFDQADWLRQRADASVFELQEVRSDYSGLPRVVVLRRR